MLEHLIWRARRVVELASSLLGLVDADDAEIQNGRRHKREVVSRAASLVASGRRGEETFLE